jgi:hypothetical protein
MEGKPLAIDSSIWLYQFQATMRDKEGHGLHNAHVLGFLRRICKLLFYGVKPVFIFDGGAPTLKRSTIVRSNTQATLPCPHPYLLLPRRTCRQSANVARLVPLRAMQESQSDC